MELVIRVKMDKRHEITVFENAYQFKVSTSFTLRELFEMKASASLPGQGLSQVRSFLEKNPELGQLLLCDSETSFEVTEC